MVVESNGTFGGHHFVVYIDVKLECCLPETSNKKYKERKEALWGFLKPKGLRITLLLLKLDYLFLSLLKKIEKKQENLFRRRIKKLNSKPSSGKAKAEWQDLEPHAWSQSSVWPVLPLPWAARLSHL